MGETGLAGGCGGCIGLAIGLGGTAPTGLGAGLMPVGAEAGVAPLSGTACGLAHAGN